MPRACGFRLLLAAALWSVSGSVPPRLERTGLAASGTSPLAFCRRRRVAVSRACGPQAGTGVVAGNNGDGPRRRRFLAFATAAALPRDPVLARPRRRLTPGPLLAGLSVAGPLSPNALPPAGRLVWRSRVGSTSPRNPCVPAPSARDDGAVRGRARQPRDAVRRHRRRVTRGAYPQARPQGALGLPRLAGREALLCYVLRPPIAQDRLLQRPDGLVRITVKKAYTDGTVAVDMDKAVAALPPGHERAYAALPHRALRGRARGRQPVEAPHRAEGARGGAGRGERAARPNGAGRPLPSVGGAALRARSPWTSSAVPPVTDA